MSKLRFLPGARFGGLQGGAGRQPASRINAMANEQRILTGTVAARGALLPILFGRRDIPGMIKAVGKIGSDLVLGVIWSIGRNDAIEAVYLNDAAPAAGITVVNYVGTPTQGVDPALESAIPAFADTVRLDTPAGKRGVAYSSIRIPPDKLDGWPRVRATVRGRHVYDPRTDTTAYSDNAALCLADLIADPDYGLGLAVAGVEEAADWCDSLLGGVVERCRLSLYIAKGMPAVRYVDLLAEYAECFWVREGGGVRLIPDAPVDLESVPVVGPADYLAGSLQLSAQSSIDTPTEVEVQHTEPSSTAAEAWGMESELAVLPGVATGEVSRVPTSVQMEGVYRSPEAANKALSRLRRMQNRMTAQWVTRDVAVMYQTGDVQRIVDEALGVEIAVRIENVDLVDPGRYGVTASRYDVDHYPSDLILPEDIGTVPVGAIVLMGGTETPSGWEAFSAANGKYIIGAGGALSVGETGGSSTFSISGNTTSNGSHAGATQFRADRYAASPSGPYVGRTLASTGSQGAHVHTYATGSVNHDLYTRRARLIRKTGTAGLKLPANAAVFGAPGILHPDVTRVLTDAGRLIEAYNANAQVGTTSKSVALTIGQSDDTHTHHSLTWFSGLSADTDFGPWPTRYDPVQGGALHTHTATAPASRNPKRRRLALYSGAGEYPVVPGTIVLYEGATLPDDWVLCDGTAPTVDLRACFVEVATEGNENTVAGDDTVSIAAATNEVSHSHRGSGYTSELTTIDVSHEESVAHSHTLAGTHAAWRPPYYALKFIMFAPGG